MKDLFAFIILVRVLKCLCIDEEPEGFPITPELLKSHTTPAKFIK